MIQEISAVEVDEVDEMNDRIGGQGGYRSPRPDRITDRFPDPLALPLTPIPSRAKRHRPPLTYGYMSGAELRKWRTSKRWTQRELGASLGYSQEMISQWERNRLRIPYEIYPALIQMDYEHIAAGLAVVNMQTGEIYRLF